MGLGDKTAMVIHGYPKLSFSARDNVISDIVWSFRATSYNGRSFWLEVHIKDEKQ